MAIGDVLVIGSGAREHALIWKLKQSQSVKTIYSAPGNAGTEKIAQNVSISPTNLPHLLAFAREKDIDLTVVGPELPLKLGIVDLFRKNSLDIFGPTAKAAMLETSKVFAKYLMLHWHIPTAPFQVFHSYHQALMYVHKRNLPFVIKKDGLAYGKGVFVCRDIKQAERALRDIMINHRYGDSDNTVIVENVLIGKEVSIHAICRQNTSGVLVPSQDNKALYDNNKGPNTGGIGSFVPIPTFTEQNLFHVEQTIIHPILKALKARGTPFIGCLYPGLIDTPNGIYVLEFNARFGDPETQPLVTLMNGDLFLALKDSYSMENNYILSSLNNKYAVCVVLCSKEYPESQHKQVPIYGIKKAYQLSDKIMIFHGATIRINRKLYTNGGRILSVVVTGDSLEEARMLAYSACELIEFHGKHYRTDIAKEDS